jgi:hypothetical protein
MPNLTATVSQRAPRVPQRNRDLLQMMDLLRDEAAEDVKLAFPADESKRLLGLPCASPWGISRARHGDDTNPLYRVRCWILALRKIGAPRERAQRIIDRLQDLVDMLWPTTTTRTRRSSPSASRRSTGRRMGCSSPTLSADRVPAAPGSTSWWTAAR